MSGVPLARRCAAEALGTLLLVATVVGSGIMAERLAGGNIALALLGNTLATGAILVVLITVLGPISGAHFNPAVSLVMWHRRTLPAAELGPYLLAQAIGGVGGTWLAHAMFALAVLQGGSTVRASAGELLGEVVATFALLLTILGTLRTRPEAVPWTVGLVITAGYWFTSSTSFANPAVTLARALSDSFSGIRPVDAPAFVAAQLAGGALAHLAARYLFDERVGA
jgi:glycerol uptake facilitator-like aquaporin